MTYVGTHPGTCYRHQFQNLAMAVGATLAVLLSGLLVSPAVVRAQVCGNQILEMGEACDLGVANCLPSQCCETSCSDTCQILGRCTGSQACCTSAAECPVGEGCCGNGGVEGDELCDDGNRQDADCCSHACQIEPAPCVPLPAACGQLGSVNVIANPSIRRTTIRDSHPADGVFDRWIVRDRFNLTDGHTIDPDTEIVRMILNQNDGANQSVELYDAVLDPVNCPGAQCFVPRANSQGQDKMWAFRLRSSDPDIVGAPGWRFARFLRNLGFTFLIRETLKIENAVIGTPTLASGTRRARQSIVIGDVCVTRLLDCERNNRFTRLLCREVHCGDGMIHRGERCGEPGLPMCKPGKVCDTCKCVRP